MAVTNSSRPIINASLKTTLDEQTEKWGIEIVRAEIKDLEPLRELIISMESVLKADNERQATEKTAIAQATLAVDRKTPPCKLLKDKASSHLTGEGDAQVTKLRNEALTTYFKDSAIVFSNNYILYQHF